MRRLSPYHITRDKQRDFIAIRISFNVPIRLKVIKINYFILIIFAILKIYIKISTNHRNNFVHPKKKKKKS